MEIIPGVNCAEYDCVVGRQGQLGEFLDPGEWVHLDIADGIFTFNRTWNDPQAWQALRSRYQLEVHLMVNEPEFETERWIEGGAKRVITHYEAIRDARTRPRPSDPDMVASRIIDVCHRAKAEAMISTNPETSVADIIDFLAQFDGIQALAVQPGPSGQKFLPVVLEKIKFLRGSLAGATIEVDGGIEPSVVPLVKAAGANLAVSTSYIWNSPDPRKAYDLLRRL
jgi:ribulose-phosphate 3-epimerase